MDKTSARFGDHRRIIARFGKHPKLAVAFAVLVLLIGTTWVLDRRANRHLQSMIDAIRAKGEPVTAEELAATIPVLREADNMAVALLDPVDAINAYTLTEHEKKVLPHVGTARIPRDGRRLSRVQLEAARQYLGRFHSERSEIHQALQLESGWLPVEIRSPMANIDFPSITRFLCLPDVLALEAVVAANDGDVAVAAVILRDMCRALRVNEHGWILLDALIRVRFYRRAQEQIQAVVNLCGLPDDDLARLVALLADCEDRIDLKRGLIGERVHGLDYLRSLRNGSLPALGTEAVWRHTPALPAADIGAGLSVMTALVDAVGEPDGRTIERLEAVSTMYGTMPWYSMMSTTTVPQLTSQTKKGVISIASGRALRVGLACERYRLATGDWPAGLVALVPEYLDEVPSDPFGGKAIRFERIDDGVRTWSIGPDVGGNRAEKSWVILDPRLRGRAAK